MPVSNYLYPLDTTGTANTNLITNETHNVNTPATLEDIGFIVPRAAPFFKEGLIVKNGTTTWQEGVHYFLGHHFVEASLKFGKAIYGSIVIIDRNFTGTLNLQQYQTLGGEFLLDDYSIVENLTRSQFRILTVTWSQIVGLPAGFAPLPHQHDPMAVQSFEDVIASLDGIKNAIIAANAP